MGWWIALAVLVGLAVLPLGIRLRYDIRGPYGAILVGPIAIQLYPEKQKKTPEKKKAAPQSRPNIFIITQVLFQVKEHLYIIDKFMQLHNFFSFNLYKFPSCIFRFSDVL